MMNWSQLGFQDASSLVMEEMLMLNDLLMMIILSILTFVLMSLSLCSKTSSMSTNFLQNQALEFIWTIFPALILIAIVVPSLSLLYWLEDSSWGGLTIKAIGHQWFWSYEYSDFFFEESPIEFNSYMSKSYLRNLEVDNAISCPSMVPLRVLVGSSDVLHSWALPSMGVKADACPGRLNQVNFMPSRCGVYYGQCSEICGANHSFMPIKLEVGPSLTFLSWIESMKE